MTATADVLTGLIAFLKADATVAGLVGTRVYGAEIPKAEAADAPVAMIVLKASGGSPLHGGSFAQHSSARFDVFCYASTPKAAADVCLAAHSALKAMRRTVHSQVLLAWANEAGGALALRDPDTGWPLRFQPFQIYFADTPVI